MTITDLKASAYDHLAQIEYLQKELQKINQQIAEELQKTQQKENEGED